MNAIEEYKRRHRERKNKTLEKIYPADIRQETKFEGNRPYESYRHFDKQMETPSDKTRRPGRQLLVQIVLSSLLVVGAYEAHNNTQSFMKPIDQSLQAAMTQEFQFEAVSSWYEKNLGNPISFLPGTGSNQGSSLSASSNGKFAEPVTGEVTAPYSSKTKGVTVKTTSKEAVKAVQDGLVLFVGEKKATGQTIIIQHKDHSESWYGHLDKVTVKVYQSVTQGQKIGTTSGGKKGTFYFALKKGAKFIDPIQVMSFD